MEEDGVPPLEDMTTYVQQLKQRSVATTSTPQPAEHADSSLLDLDLPTERKDNGRLLVCGDKRPAEVLSAVVTNPPLSEVAKSKSGPVRTAATSFGGMRKGFLFESGSTNKSSCKEKEATPSDMTFLRASHGNGAGAVDSLRLDEVQEEMKRSQPLLASQDWVTDDLLKKIEESPVLSKAFQDPGLLQTMAEFQRNPRAVLQAAQDKPKVLQFLKEFSSLLGDHFMSLSCTKDDGGSQQSELISELPSSEEEAQMKELLCKPEVQRAMQDPEIQRLIELLKSNPEEAQRLLWANREAGFHDKVTVLLENRVLAIQTF